MLAPTTSARTAVCLASTLLLLVPFLLPEAAAQDRRAEYTIRIFETDGQCRYEIEDYSDQDTFVVEPAGRVRFQAEGTDARVEVQNDGNQRGVSGDRTIKLKDAAGNPNRGKTLNVRGRIGRDTAHKVSLWCCNKQLIGGSCDANDNDAVPADPIGSSGSSLLLWDLLHEHHGPGPGERGPSAPPLAPSPSPPDNEPLGPGGPTMEVDEEG